MMQVATALFWVLALAGEVYGKKYKRMGWQGTKTVGGGCREDQWKAEKQRTKWTTSEIGDEPVS